MGSQGRTSVARHVALAAALTLLTGNAAADHILLKDGQDISGKLSRQGDVLVIRKDDGGVLTVSAEQVQRVTLTGTLTPVEKSEVQYTKIKAAIAKTDDLHTITSLLLAFVQEYPDVPLAKPARQLLDQYNQYATDEFVKFRNQWMAPAARDAILQQGATQAKLALALYRSGKLKDALDTAQDALKTDSENTVALALAGLGSARASQWIKAKEYFQKLSEVDASNVPAHNNLAIISYIQHRDPEGLIHYKRALDAGPGNRLLLDNISEALADYKGSKDVPAYTDLARAFAQADLQMAALMAQKGLYRFGGTWVTQEQKDRLMAGVVSVQEKMAALDANYQHAVVALQTLNQQARQAAADYDSSAADLGSVNGMILQEQTQGFVDVALMGRRDAVLADLSRIDRRRQEIDAERLTVQSDIKAMRIEAQRLKAQLAASQVNMYSGVQRIMEIGDAETAPPPAAIPIPPRAQGPQLPAANPAPMASPMVAPAEWPAINPDKVKGNS